MSKYVGSVSECLLTLLQLGCGVGVPGFVAAAVGASVVLTDAADAPSVLQNAAANVLLNRDVLQTDRYNALPPFAFCKLVVDITSSVVVAPLTWGVFNADAFALQPCDVVLAADCFFDKAGTGVEPFSLIAVDCFVVELAVFDSVMSTMRFLWDAKGAKVAFVAYHERRYACIHRFRQRVITQPNSAEHTVELLACAKRWKFTVTVVSLAAAARMAALAPGVTLLRFDAA